MTTTITQQLAFAQELRARLNRGNLRQVGDGKMTGEEAQRQTDAMEGICVALEKLKDLEEVSEDMRREYHEREAAK